MYYLLNYVFYFWNIHVCFISTFDFTFRSLSRFFLDNFIFELLLLIFVVERFNFDRITDFIFVNLFDLNFVSSTETFFWFSTFVASTNIEFVSTDVIESFWWIAISLNYIIILESKIWIFLPLFLLFLVFRNFVLISLKISV